MPAHTHSFTGTATSHNHQSKMYNLNNSNYNMTMNALRLPEGVADWVNLSSSSNIKTAGGTGGDPCGITSNTSITPKGTNSSTGSSAAHNNMPPYLVVYIWERTS